MCAACAPLLWIYVQFLYVFFLAVYYSVYVATSPEASLQKPSPFFPWHIFALRDERSFHWGVCVCVCVCVHMCTCACFIQNCEYVFTLTLKSQESLGQCVCTLVCHVCVHTHAGSRGHASREATCGRVDRHVLCA